MDRAIDKSERQRGIIEKIANWIPGFHGYLQKEWRREADKLEREYIAGKLDECKNTVREVMLELTNSGKIGSLTGVERLEKKLDKLASRIKFSDYGYSGFFDTAKVNEEELDKMYQFDLDMLEAVHKVQESIKGLMNLTRDTMTLDATTREMAIGLDNLDSRYSDREQIVTRG
jgi:hypothetical protein